MVQVLVNDFNKYNPETGTLRAWDSERHPLLDARHGVRRLRISGKEKPMRCPNPGWTGLSLPHLVRK